MFRNKSIRRSNLPKRNRIRTIESLEARHMMAADLMEPILCPVGDPQVVVVSYDSQMTQPGVQGFPTQSTNGSPNYQVAPLSLVELDNSFGTARDLGILHGMQTSFDWVGATDPGDYYRFTLDDAATLRLNLRELAADIDLYLYDANGTEIARSWRGGNANELIEAPLAAGAYFAVIDPWGSAQSNYRFSLEVDEAGNSFDTARDLGSVVGVRSFSDWSGHQDTNDYYRFALDSTSDVSLSLGQLSADLDLYLYDASGVEIARSWWGGNTNELIEETLGAGEYYAVARRWGGAESNYQLSLDVDRIGNTFETAQDLGVIHGPHDFYEGVSALDAADVYRFVVDDGAEVTLQLRQLSADIDLYLYDANGNEIARSWRGGNSDELIQIALEAGTFYAHVTPWGSAASNYQLSIDVDAAGEELATATDLGIVEGIRQFTDWVGQADANDYYRFVLDEAGEVIVQLTQLSQDIDLYLYDEYGNEIIRSWLGGNADEHIQVELLAGAYFMRVTPWGDAESNYELTLRTNVAGETFDTARDLGVVSRPLGFSDWVGQVDANDYYRFVLDQEVDMTLRLDQLSQDIDLYLYDANGNEITRSWRGGSADELIQETLVAGMYYIRVTPWIWFESDYHLSLDVDFGNSSTEPLADVPYFGGANDWNINAVNAPEAWVHGFTGAGVIVAVIDTGVDYYHSELAGNIWQNAGELAGNGLDDDGNGFVDDVQGWDFNYGDNDPMDVYGHGTHVAGTIAAANNGYGATGVAFDALIMPVQVLDHYGYGSWESVAAGIRYAVDNGADIINLSLGGGYSSVIAGALEYANAMGVFVAAAAGNEASATPGYPAHHSAELSNVLSVGAHDVNNQLAYFSNGVGNSGAVQIDAPGANVFSTLPGNSYANWDGTSMATPHVAGVAALALGANPNLTPSQLRQLLVAGATHSILGSDSAGGLNAAMSVAMALESARAVTSIATAVQGGSAVMGFDSLVAAALEPESGSVIETSAVDWLFASEFNGIAKSEAEAFDAAYECWSTSIPVAAPHSALLGMSNHASSTLERNKAPLAHFDAVFESLWDNTDADEFVLQLV